MKVPTQSRIGQNATSSVNDGPSHPRSQAFKDGWDRVFKKRKPTPGYTVIRYVDGKRIEVNNCEVKSRAEVGLAPNKVSSI